MEGCRRCEIPPLYNFICSCPLYFISSSTVHSSCCLFYIKTWIHFPLNFLVTSIANSLLSILMLYWVDDWAKI